MMKVICIGILNQLFAIKPSQAINLPTLNSILPQAAIQELQNGKLPLLRIKSLILKKGEFCHYADKTYLFQQKKITYHYRKNHGVNFRITKRVSYHIGQGKSQPVEEEIPEYIPGYLYITNQRIIFSAKNKGFVKSLSHLTTMVEYSDGISLQCDTKVYNFLLPSPHLAYQALSMLK